LFIRLSIRIFLRKFHYHASGRSDDLTSQKYVLKPERFDLLSVFRSICKVHLEQQKQIVGQHHQLKNGFVGPKGLGYRTPAEIYNMNRKSAGIPLEVHLKNIDSWSSK